MDRKVYRMVTIPIEAPVCHLCNLPILSATEDFYSYKQPMSGPVHRACAINTKVLCKKCQKEMRYADAHIAYWDYPNYYCDDCISSTFPPSWKGNDDEETVTS